MYRALITGVTGFAGSHLADHLWSLGTVEVHGLRRASTVEAQLPHEAEAPAIERGLERKRRETQGTSTVVHTADLADRVTIRALVAAVRPDLVFHLAAQASVAAAWKDPAGTLVNNVVGQINLLDAVVELCPGARVLVVGSAEEYGLVQPGELPIGEAQPFRPNNPYAVSKIGQDMLGYQYFVARKLAVVRVRPFNHIGPRQRDDFVAAGFARQVAEAEAGLIPPIIRVGNLEARRDFTDVRDVARAYWLALVDGEPGDVYNVASGRSVAIRELLETLLSLSRRPLAVEQDPSRLRPSDVPDLVGDASKLRARTGWAPERSLGETLRDTLEYWREQVRTR